MSCLKRLLPPGYLLVFAAASGCTPGLTAIPLGEWAGRGTVIDCQTTAMGEGSDAGLRRKSMDGTYETRLSITKQRLFGHDALVFEIRSNRGKLLSMDDTETHIRMALVELEKLGNGATLYGLADWKYRPGPDDTWSEEHFRQRVGFPAASCLRTGSGLVLQVHYIVPGKDDALSFKDTFQFERGRVIKTGSVVSREANGEGKKAGSPDFGAIYWSEELHRLR